MLIHQNFIAVYTYMLRKMIRGGLQRYDEENDFRFKICNKKLLDICDAEMLLTLLQGNKQNT